MWQDLMNGSFEFLAAFASLNHSRVAYKHKKVSGVSKLSVAFFTLWGLWNLYYYPHLGQWASFAGGIVIMLANTLWLVLLWKYRGNK